MQTLRVFEGVFGEPRRGMAFSAEIDLPVGSSTREDKQV